MTKSELFTAAHELARTFEGDYRACFALALNEIREENDYLGLVSVFEYNLESRNLKKPTYKINDVEKARELYKVIAGTFAAKVLATVMKEQNGIATEKQKDIIVFEAAA